MAAPQDISVISDQLRQKARQQLEETFTKYTNPFPKSAEEIENTIYESSKNAREKYLGLIKQILMRAQRMSQISQHQNMSQQGGGVMRPPMPMSQQQQMQQQMGQQMSQSQQMQQPQMGGGMRQFANAGMPRGPPTDSPQNISMQSPLSSGGITGYSPDNRMTHPSPGSQFYQHRPQLVTRPPQPPQPQQPPLRMPDNPYPNAPHGSVGSTYIPSLSPAHPNNSPQLSAMSPALRTPGSVTVAHSPASAAVASPSTNQNQANNTQQSEEQLYMEKLKQLQKYIEPLSRMINKISSNKEKNSKDLSKMKSLRDVLMDSNKRLAMGTLLKCEKVLQNWLDVKPPPTPPPSRPDQHMCQPILDAVASDINSQLINHTLKRTFGPALQVLNGDYYVPESSCTKRRRLSKNSDKEDSGSGIRVPNVVQGEIARLGSKFKVTVDQSQSSNCGTLHLICRLDDSSLPSVPPIRLLVPSAYPREGPEWKPWEDSSESEDLDSISSSEQDDSTASNRPTFLSKLKPRMSTHINHAMDHNETISSILTAWVRSVKETMHSDVKATG